MARIAVAGFGLMAGISAAIAFSAGSAVAQAAVPRAPEYTQTLVVSSLNNAGPGSLRAAILAANATPAGEFNPHRLQRERDHHPEQPAANDRSERDD